MVPTQPKDTNTKVSSCNDSRHSKHLTAKPKPKPKPKVSSIGTLSNLNLQQTVALVSPGKGEFFDCTDGGLVDVDLTSDKGMTGTGMNGAFDLTNEGTLDGDGGFTDDGSVSNGRPEDGSKDGGLTNGGFKMDGLEGVTTGPPKLVVQLTDDSTGEEEMTGDNMMGGVVNKNGSVQVSKFVSDSMATDDDLARINTDIGDVQHLIDTSTGVAQDLAQGDLLRLQQLLGEKKKMMTGDEIPDGGLKDTQDDMVIGKNVDDLTGKPFADPNTILGRCEIGGSDTVNLLVKKSSTTTPLRLRRRQQQQRM